MKRLFLLAWMLFTIVFLYGDGSGEFVYVQGTVDVLRGGSNVDWQLVDIGFILKQYDLVETDRDGTAEIAYTSPAGSDTTIVVEPGTSFYFEVSESAEESKSNISMMKGAVGVRVSRLTSRESIQVRTHSTAMGVRGTKFEVTIAPDGGILVTVDEGSVVCEDEQGRKLVAEPGYVVENVPDRHMSRFQIDPEDIPLYRVFWMDNRMEVFKAGADTFIRGYAQQYNRYLPRFEDAYNVLMVQKNTLEQYALQDPLPPMGTLFKVKSQVGPAVIGMRSILPLFEMTFFRLKELESFHADGIGRTRISQELTSDQFFRSFRQRRQKIDMDLAMVRYLFSLYYVIDQATGGGPSIMDDIMPGSGVPSGSPPAGSPPAGRSFP